MISEEVRSGLISSAAVAVTAGICGRIELGTALPPINGISHILWGPQAGEVNRVSAKYTLAGLAINTVACGFWAWLYQKAPERTAARSDSVRWALHVAQEARQDRRLERLSRIGSIGPHYLST